jgi:hypothetical protein
MLCGCECVTSRGGRSKCLVDDRAGIPVEPFPSVMAGSLMFSRCHVLLWLELGPRRSRYGKMPESVLVSTPETPQGPFGMRFAG